MRGIAVDSYIGCALAKSDWFWALLVTQKLQTVILREVQNWETAKNDQKTHYFFVCRFEFEEAANIENDWKEDEACHRKSSSLTKSHIMRMTDWDITFDGHGQSAVNGTCNDKYILDLHHKIQGPIF